MREKKPAYEAFKDDLEVNTNELMVRVWATIQTIDHELKTNRGLMPWQKKYLNRRMEKLKKILASLNQSKRTRED